MRSIALRLIRVDRDVPIACAQWIIADVLREYQATADEIIQSADNPALKDHYEAQIDLVRLFAEDVSARIEREYGNRRYPRWSSSRDAPDAGSRPMRSTSDAATDT